MLEKESKMCANAIKKKKKKWADEMEHANRK